MADVDKTKNMVELKIEEEAEQTEVKKSSRRPDIDLIRILLTWGILLYHTVLIYTPLLPYYLKVFPDQLEEWHWSSFWFIISMNAWNMPMFFFLSGISAFFGLKKRDENQFRMERVHRLLVPAIFLSLTSSFSTGLNYFSKLSPNCQEFSEFKNVSLKTGSGYSWTHCEMYNPVRGNESYSQYLKELFLPFPSPSQGWFLCYLFVFSQTFAPLFLLVHPDHQDQQKFGCFRRLLSKKIRVDFCFDFSQYFTTANKHFVKGVKFWLGHPLKLALIPSLLIGLVEALLRPTSPDDAVGFFAIFADTYNLLHYRVPSAINYITVFLLGFGITVADEHGMKEVIKKGRWFNLVIGVLINILFSFKSLPIIHYPPDSVIVDGVLRFLRGPSEWLLILGLYGVTRELVTKTFSPLSVLSELAMPFYLTHQQVLVMITAGASWYPHLRSLPVVLSLSTAGTLALSWVITRAGPLRYFFGLPSKTLPGSCLRGTVPTVVLGSLFIVACVLANHL